MALMLLLFAGCGAATYLVMKLSANMSRINDLHQELTKNDEQMKQQLERMRLLEAESAARQDDSKRGASDAGDARS